MHHAFGVHATTPADTSSVLFLQSHITSGSRIAFDKVHVRDATLLKSGNHTRVLLDDVVELVLLR